MHQGRAIVRTAIACIVIYGVVKLCFLLFSPFVLSGVIYIMIQPIIKKLVDRYKLNRNTSIIVALLFFCFLSFAGAYFIIDNIYNEAVSILKNAPIYYERLIGILQRGYFFIISNLNLPHGGQNIESMVKAGDMFKSLSNLIVALKDSIIGAIYILPDIVMYLTFSTIAAFFMLRDEQKIKEVLKKVLPPYVVTICSKLHKSLISIIKTEAILIGISTLQTAAGLMIMGNEYALTIGITAGILDIIPLIGPGIIFIPWVFYSYAQGRFLFASSLLCLYIIIVVTRQILQTHMISGSLELHPLIILISIYIGLKFYGIIGALLGPIMAGVLKMIYIENTC